MTVEELKNLVIHRDDIKQMSKEQIRELNSQFGWFSNDIEDFDDLSKCHYDEPNTDGFDLYSYYSEEAWEYFLPVKSLQKFIEVKKGTTIGA